MDKKGSVTKKVFRFTVYGIAAGIGVAIAIASAKNKGKKIKKGGKKLLNKTKFVVKSAKDNLNMRQKRILSLFDKEEEITNEMIAEVINGVSKRTIRRDLDFLEEKGYIKQIGKTKGSYYVLR